MSNSAKPAASDDAEGGCRVGENSDRKLYAQVSADAPHSQALGTAFSDSVQLSFCRGKRHRGLRRAPMLDAVTTYHNGAAASRPSCGIAAGKVCVGIHRQSS